MKTRTALFRSHALGTAPVWFGPGQKPPAFRFDAPDGQYGVCCAGRTEMAALVETFFRDLPVRVLSRATLELRRISTLVLRRPIRLVRIHGASLPRIGATTAVGGAKLAFPAGSLGKSYEHSQAWSLALHDHPAKPDGIQYRSSHDDELLCVAIFGDRAADAVDVTELGAPLTGRKQLLASAIRRYGVRLL